MRWSSDRAGGRLCFHILTADHDDRVGIFVGDYLGRADHARLGRSVDGWVESPSLTLKSVPVPPEPPPLFPWKPLPPPLFPAG